MMRLRIAKERYDLCDFAAAAIKATYSTREPGGVERCIEALNHLKSMSFSVKDTQFSESISKLETLRSHRNPKIRKEAHALFDSWMKTLYAQGRDNSSKACLTQFHEENKDAERSQTLEAVVIKNQDPRSLRRETEKVKKEANIDSLALEHKEDHKSETCEEKVTKNDLKPLNLKRIRVASEDATSKKPRGAVTYVASSMKKIELELSVIATTLPHHSRQNIKDTDRQVTTKTLIPPPRRDAACKNVPRRPVYRTEQKQTEPVKDSTNPKSAVLKTKTEKELKSKKVEEMVELFESAKKAADVANAKGVLLGKQEAYRCVDALSLLMRLNITPKPKEPRRMMERLEGLTKHKDRNICSAASALLHLCRQRIRKQGRKESVTKTFPNNFTRESTKMRGNK